MINMMTIFRRKLITKKRLRLILIISVSYICFLLIIRIGIGTVWNSQLPPSIQRTNQHYNYIINEMHLCTNSPSATTLLYVFSKPSNFQNRDCIRSTWGNRQVLQKLNILIVFLMGNPMDSNVMNLISKESQKYHDIIQMDYIDSYRNLTHKAISALQWITEYCTKVLDAVKVDDDVFVNVYKMNRFLKRMRLSDNTSRDRIRCWLNTRYVARDLNSKWYVSYDMFSGWLYPPVCHGFVYILPRVVVSKLYNGTSDVPFFWLEDVYLTGFVAQLVKVTHDSIKDYVISGSSDHYKNIVYGDTIFAHINSMFKEKTTLIWKAIVQIETDL